MSSPTKEPVGDPIEDSARAPGPGIDLQMSDAKSPRPSSPQLEGPVAQDHNLNESSHGHVSSADVPSLNAPVVQQEIEAVEDQDPALGTTDNAEVDSAYGDDLTSYTMSLTSAVTSYKYENGRRYHAQEDQKYFLPNDDKENDRLDLFHHLLTLRLDDKLHLAPIGSNPQNVLDLGTGSGIWAIEMGEAYPSAEVLGNDLSPIQPTLVPPNVKFEVDDIERPWTFSHKFDYIHCRYLAGALRDWPRLMEQAFKFTKPGGWVEFQDFDMKFYSTDGTFIPGSSPDVWTQEIVTSVKSFGCEPEPGPKLEQWLLEAGFENISAQVLPIPVGLWPKDKRMKEIGACDLSMFLEGLEAISLRALTAGRGWTPEEVLVFLPSVRKGLLNRGIHALHNFYVVYAQKPSEPVLSP